MTARIEITDKEILDEISSESKKVTSVEVEEVASRESEIEKKSKKLDKDKFSKLFSQVKLALQMLKDYRAKKYTGIPWRTIGLITVGLLYFLNPFDVVPDLIPLVGYSDDAIALAAIFKSIQSDLKIYCEWKGLDVNNYF